MKAVNSAKGACEDKMNSQDCAGYKDLGMCKSHGEFSAVPHAVPPILQCACGQRSSLQPYPPLIRPACLAGYVRDSCQATCDACEDSRL